MADHGIPNSPRSPEPPEDAQLDEDDDELAEEPKPSGPLWLRLCSYLSLTAAIGWLGWQWFLGSAQVRAEEATFAKRLAAELGTSKSQSDAEEAKLRAAREKQDSEFQAEIRDPAFLDGARARERHEQEWQRRLDHDPQLAKTNVERNLVEMEKVSADSAIAPQAALEKIAALASPPGSRVEVTPNGKAFDVKIAFMLTAVLRGASGGVTRQTSEAGLHHEVLRLSAQIARDILAYGGSRGVAALSVTCNQNVLALIIPATATPNEAQLLRSNAKMVREKVFHLALDTTPGLALPDWRSASFEEVARVLRVDFDALDSIEFAQSDAAGGSAPKAAEPGVPLVF